MLTVAEDTLHRLAKEHGKEVAIHLFGQEINAETYAISKADLLLKGEGEDAENFKHASTLSMDAFPSREFDFMLSNPPYGKSWKTDLERMGGKGDIKDARFVINHVARPSRPCSTSTGGTPVPLTAGDPEFSLVTRSSDGQLMFLVNMLGKMKSQTALGSRVAEVHNGSSLFTGDAGQGESNVRRWIIENDWLDAIIALPLDMFYNTGIATYIWVLTNRKPKKRKGKVQLIDATEWYKPLRKNLGKKNCELAEEHVEQICKTFLAFEETEQSKIFPNEAFGFWKITVERPLRLRVDLSEAACARFRKACKLADEEPLANLVDRVAKTLGPGPHLDYNHVLAAVEADAETHNVKLPAKRLKLLQTRIAEKHESAKPVIRKLHKPGKAKPDVLHGRYEVSGTGVPPVEIQHGRDGRATGKPAVVEYEPDTDLRDTEQVPLLENGGIEAFFRREVLPHVPDAWIDESVTRIGYEISFTRYFYKPQPLRTLEAIRADILALEKETEGLLGQIVGGGT
jgi:type I restriction enzyme M protein